MKKKLSLALAGSVLAISGCSGSGDAHRDLPNLLLVTIDTVRSDRLGAYGYERAQTPVLDSLAERGVVFEEAYSPAPMTLPVHSTLMTGLLPPEHGARVNGMHKLAQEVPTLAEHLSAYGYRTGAFIAAFVLDRRFGLDRGFDVYDDDLSEAYEQKLHEGLSTYRPADVVVSSALSWLEAGELDQPFFAWVHLYDAHYPWHPHGADVTDRNAETGTYDGEIAFVDAQIGRLVQYLRENGLEENTVVVALADHGEGLGDHHEIEHAYLLNEEVLHVPWIMAGPGIDEGQRVRALVTLEDFQPTALELVGFNQPGNPRSLVPALRGETRDAAESYAETDLPWTAFRWGPQRSLTTEEWKYIRSPQPELYNRATDRGELANLATARKDVLAQLEARLSEIEAALVVRESDVAPVSNEELEQLAALGYAAGTEAELPGGIAGLEGLADVKERLGIKDLATELRKAVEMGTIAPEVRLSMAQRLVEASPETPSFHSQLGRALVEIGARERALASLDRVVELAPTDAGAHYDLGDVLQQLGQTQRAREHLELALEIAPEMAAAHVGMGNVQRAEGRPDLAAGEYSEALRLRPGYAEAYFNLAQTFVDRNKPQQALEHMLLALEHKPGWDLAHRAIANSFMSMGRVEESIEHFEAACASLSSDANLQNDLGAAYYQLGRMQEAYESFVRALEIDPKFFRPYLNLGNLAFNHGRDDVALERYEAALQLIPGLPEPYARLARFLATTGSDQHFNGPRAVALAERANQLSGASNSLVLHTLALAKGATGHFEEAIAIAGEAEKLARRSGNAQLVQEIQAHIGLFATGKAFRLPPSTLAGEAPASTQSVSEQSPDQTDESEER